MPSLIQSISPLKIAGGIVVAVLAAALSVSDLYNPPFVVAVSIALLAIVIALRGLQPFGDTMAYHLLQAGVFAVWGITVIVAEEITVIPIVFLVVGLIGVLYYGRQATQQGLWTPVSH